MSYRMGRIPNGRCARDRLRFGLSEALRGPSTGPRREIARRVRKDRPRIARCRPQAQGGDRTLQFWFTA
jgi:hypothetical protein